MTVIQLKTPAERKAEVIAATLDELAAVARAGRPVALTCMMVMDDGEIETGMVFESIPEVLGNLELIKGAVLKSYLEDDE